jgi:predicted 3-demethylubiquinone-9 3-methyltransferase (glyoxalase superfamily)
MQKIVPFLWFDGKAEEAMNFYTSIFKNSKIKTIHRYGDAGPGPQGTVMSGTFEINGQEFMALNGGPQFTFTPAISFFVNCESQAEVDELGRSSPPAARKAAAAGCVTSLASHGRSFPLRWAKCWATPTAPKRTASCRPC